MKKTKIMVLLSCLLLLCACSRSTAKLPDVEKTNTNTYKEVEVAIPKDAQHVLGAVNSQEGNVRIFTVDKAFKNPKIFESNSGGDDWQEVADLSKYFPENAFEQAEESFPEVTLTQDNRAIVSILKLKENTEHDYSQEIYIVDEKNNVNPLNQTVTEQLNAGNFFSYGLVKNQFVTFDNQNAKTLVFNIKTGSLEKEFTTESFLVANIHNDKLYYQGQTLEVVSGTTFEKEPLTTSLKKVEEVWTKSTGNTHLVFGNQGNYLLNESGMYEITEDGTENMLFSSNKTSLADSNNQVAAVLAISNKEFLTFVVSKESSKIVKLVPNKDKKTSKNKVFKVYSLYNDDYIKQLTVLYQKEHPELDVIHEYGIDTPSDVGKTKDSIPTNDLLKLLNTRIANGDGPDVLMLDNLNANDYREQGLLADLSGIIKKQDKDKVWTNVFESYKYDNKYYGLPNQISLLTTLPAKDFNENLDSINDITEYLVSLSKSTSTDVYAQSGGFEQLSSILYHIFLSEDKKLTRDNIKTYYSSLKALYALVDLSDYETEMKKISYPPFNIRAGAFSVGLEYSILEKEAQISVSFLQSPVDIIKNESVAKELKEVLNIVETSKNKYYVPLNSLGILETSKNKETAREFLEFSLTEKGQKANVYDLFGLSLNKSILKDALKSWGKEKLTGETYTKHDVSVKNIGYSDELYKDWDEKISSLNTPLTFNQIVVDILFEDIENILHGDVDVDKAADTTFSKIELYLKE